MFALRRPLVSEAEFLAMPETNDKVELIDGEVTLSPAPSLWHQELLGRIIFELRAWALAAPATVTIGQAPVDIRFAPDRILQPDGFVILGRFVPPDAGPLLRVPEICIEVLSSNRVYDRVTKRQIYATAGVLEYWIVEPSGPIERCHGPGLERVEIVSQRLSSALLPGFSLDVAALHADPSV